MLVLIFITAGAALLFYYFIIKPYDFWKDKGVKQGNPVWIFGDSLGIFSKKQSFFEMVQNVYTQFPGRRYSGIYQFLTPILLVKDPDLIKRLTVKDFDHFTDHRPFIPEDADPLWGKNLVSLNGKKWRDMRVILSPSFTSSKMKTMFVLMLECAENFVQHFLRKDEDVVTVEFEDAFTRFTNDVIASTAFGLQVDSLGQPKNQFYMMGREATDLSGLKMFGYLLFPKLYQLLKIPLFSKEVSTYFRQVVSDMIKTREEKGIVRPDMIHLLLEARRGVQRHEENNVIDTGFSTAQESDLGENGKLPKEITDMDITAQAMVFFFAGFNTVSGLMCFLAYEMATNPDIQDRLRDEIRSTSEEYGSKITYEGLLKMKYMDMVVSETLRKWPIIPAADRICTKPYTIEPTKPDEKPLRLQEGDVVWLPVSGIHRDPKNFPDPERFDPERFSDENKGNIKPYTYFPFGLGPRNCIGSRFALLETKLVIFHILKHFELVPVKESIIPLKISGKQFGMTAEGGFWFGLKRLSA